MRREQETLVRELHALVHGLGTRGGLIGPSIYDTAQVLRLAPPAQSAAGLGWLMAQQQPDGGWGDPAVPLARTASTMAAILAIAHHRGAQDRAIAPALRYLAQQAPIWDRALPEDLPAGVELLVPHLADQMAACGLTPPSRYAELRALGAHRHALIARVGARAGTTIAHSWEAWGHEPGADLIDDAGSMGHSPAATAAWLRASAGRDELSLLQIAAQRYLEDSSAATGVGIAGVVPTAWPISRFEQCFALYMLCVAGLHRHPVLAGPIVGQLRRASAAMGPRGIGYSDWFAPDGDDTAALCAALAAAGLPARLDTLAHFADGDHYCAWQGELQPATSVTSHALHALRSADQPHHQPLDYLLRRQQPDGRWLGDKWNRSWVYTTTQALIALAGAPAGDAIERGVSALLAGQHPSGAWGWPAPSGEETAYATLALRALLDAGGLALDAVAALGQGEAWLTAASRPRDGADVACWLAKEPYRPERLARICEIAAELVAIEQPVGLLEIW